MNRLIDEAFGWKRRFNYQKKELPPAVASFKAGLTLVSHLLVGDSEEVCVRSGKCQSVFPACSASLQLRDFLKGLLMRL